MRVREVSQQTPLRLETLEPLVAQLEARVEMPLTVTQITSGDWVVLKIDTENLCRGVADRLRGYQNVAQAEVIGEALGFIRTFLLVFAFIAVFVGAFIIFNTFSILVAQRSRELAMLRALGAGRRQVQQRAVDDLLGLCRRRGGVELIAGDQHDIHLVLGGQTRDLGEHGAVAAIELPTGSASTTWVSFAVSLNRRPLPLIVPPVPDDITNAPSVPNPARARRADRGRGWWR